MNPQTSTIDKLEFFQNPENTVVVRMLIMISPWNLPHGFLPNSNFILLKIINVSKLTSIANNLRMEFLSRNSKLNYKLHTEAIKDTITQDLTPEQSFHNNMQQKVIYYM